MSMPPSHPAPIPQVDAPTPRPNAFHFYSFLLGLLTSLLLVGGSVLLLRRPQPAPIVLQPPPTPVPTATPAPPPTPGPITVFVSGAVAAPGLVDLPGDARVGDALSAAGGLTADADPALVNQAQLLWDGAQVHVPAALPTESPGSTALFATAPPAGVSGGDAGFVAGALPGSPSAGGRVDINRASAQELETLPGVGPARAQAIIDNRPYATVADLQRVPGIGTKTLEAMLDLITVE